MGNPFPGMNPYLEQPELWHQPILGAAETDYHILVSRSDRRPEADLYSFNLPDPIPAVPVPLNPGDPEPVINVQKLLNEVYERARFDLSIDYSQPLNPVLLPKDEAWAKGILTL